MFSGFRSRCDKLATLPFLGNGTYNNIDPVSVPTGGTVADWTIGGNLGTAGGAVGGTGSAGGAFAPTPGGVNFATHWFDGNNVGYLQNLTGSGLMYLSQVLTDTLQNNATYTLQVDVARRQFSFGSFGYAIQLWAGGTELGSASSLSLGIDQFGTDTLTVSTGASNPEAGQRLEIRLASAPGEVFFDRVALSGAAASSAVPEPATVWGAFAGLAMILAAGRSRRRA